MGVVKEKKRGWGRSLGREGNSVKKGNLHTGGAVKGMRSLERVKKRRKGGGGGGGQVGEEARQEVEGWRQKTT